MSEFASIIILAIIFLLLLRKCLSKKVMWFYRPDCGYCQKMENEWKKVEIDSMFTLLPPIDAVKININEACNAKIAENYGVNSVPFIVKLDHNGIRDVYNGERKAKSILSWVNS